MSTKDDGRARRRRKRRLAAAGIFLVVALALAWVLEKQATTTVFIARYAETLDSPDGNPGLTAKGQRRAAELARVLAAANVDRSVDAIFATEWRNTQETVEPLAKQLGIPVQIVEEANVGGLRDLIEAGYKGRMVLVVTSPFAMNRLVRRLNGVYTMPEVADGEHDRLYVLAVPWFGKVDTVSLRYGAPYRP